MRDSGAVLISIAAVGLLLVVASLGLVFHDGLPRVKDEIDALVVGQIGVTVLVGFFLTQYVGRHLGERNAEKQILIQNTRDALASLRQVFDAFERCCDDPSDTEQQQSLLRDYKHVSAAFSSLEQLLSECDAADAESRLRSAIPTLIGLHRHATGRWPSAPLPEDRVGVENAYRSLHHDLSRLVILLNHL